MAEEKTRRQLNLVICLLATRRYLSAREIRATVQGYEKARTDAAFKRMFERDKDELRRSGIPLAVGDVDVWGDERGYRISPAAYQLSPIQLLPDEAAVLGLAARAWRFAALGGAAADAVLKLRAAGIPADGAVGGTVTPVVATGESAFPAVWEALRDRRAIAFDYRPPGREPARRSVEPWGVVNRRGHWYVAGYDRTRGAPRVFRLGRVVGGVDVDRKGPEVEVPVGADVASLVTLERQRESERVAVVRVRKDTAYEIRRGAQGIGSGAEGWDEVRYPYADTSELAALLAGFGDRVEVVEPDALRQAVVRRLRALAEREPESGAPVGVSRSESGQPGVGSSNEQLRRLLSLVPFAMRGEVSVGGVAEHFGLTERQVLRDLSLLWTCGLPGYLPGDLIEVDMDAARTTGEIIIGNADTLAAPLRLTADEAVSLLVGVRLLDDLPGAADSAALRRVAGKLREAAGAAVERLADAVEVRVELSEEVRRTQALVDSALREGRRVHLRYHSYYRDDVTERDVDPMRLVLVDGYPYMEGWCRLARGTRMFRLDRVLGISVLPEAAEVPPDVSVRELGEGALHRSADDALITVELAAEARWVAEDYVCERVAELGGGRLLVTLRTPDTGWARRLVLGLGDAARVLAPEGFAAEIRAEARRALERYGG